jgi:hypothetical protein
MMRRGPGLQGAGLPTTGEEDQAMRSASTVVLVGLAAWLAATPAFALDTLPFCDNLKDPNERMKCLQAHISHLEESILGLSTQIADLNNQLRQKADMDTPYKLLFSQIEKCLGSDDQQPAFVTCTDPDAFSLMDRSKSGKAKKPEAQPVIDPKKIKKQKNKDKAADSSSDKPAKPAAASGAGQTVPKTSQ